FSNVMVNTLDTNGVHNVNEVDTQISGNEVRSDENKPDLANIQPKNKTERAAYKAWKTIDPDNPASLRDVYFNPATLELPDKLFEVFTREIMNDKSDTDKSAVFKE